MYVCLGRSVFVLAGGWDGIVMVVRLLGVFSLVCYSRRVRKGVHWMHVHPPPPTWEKSSAQKCLKEERKFRPDMSAKKNEHVSLRYDKIKTKKIGKNKKIVKRKD